LNGPFFVRQVITTQLDTNTSAIGRAVSLLGIMTFDGQGNYNFVGQKVDTKVGGAGQAFLTNGTYLVASNGMAQIQNPIDSNDTEFGGVTGVGPVSIVASATEGLYSDVFVAIQAGSGASNGSITGAYSVGFIDFLQAEVSQVRDGYFTFNSSGTGSLGSLDIHGAMANLNSTNVTQTVAGVTYSINTPNGVGVLTFPTASTPLNALVSGQKTLYVSADGSLLLGGDPNGFDLIIGVKSVSSGASNSMYQGTYYNAALENDASDESNGNDIIDSFYGSTLALGSQGATISHERLVYFDGAPFDYTLDGTFNFLPDGTCPDCFYHYAMGVNGQAVLEVGTGTTYSLFVNLAAQPTQATSVFINPLSIFNAASYAPITNPVAPGEFITIFGSGFTSSSPIGAQTLPLPKTLGNVQVTVNGQPAPLLYVSSTQINFLIPFATTDNGLATIQVTNNGVASNQVTVYTSASAPGLFTFSADGSFPPGTGPATVTHLDYSLVTADNPAVGGETLILYLTGLGAVTPAVADGAAGPSNPPSTVNESDSISMDIFDQDLVVSSFAPSFAGLAPGFAGLYQINFVVPTGVASGLAYLDLSTNEAYTTEAKIYMK
jgi:uncharacterized protein (TIGR03437 family)